MKNGCHKNGKESNIKIISKNSKGIPDGVTIFVDGQKQSKKLEINWTI
jgi:hypothetical protein